MASLLPIKAPPLNEVRIAVYDRLQTSEHTQGYNLLREGLEADWPYLAVGPAYKGAGGTDVELGVNVVVQVEAYALSSEGGTKTVSDMISNVYAALSAETLEVSPYRPLAAVVEDDVLNASQLDPASGELYAQRFVRFRFMVGTF